MDVLSRESLIVCCIQTMQLNLLTIPTNICFITLVSLHLMWIIYEQACLLLLIYSSNVTEFEYNTVNE